MVLKLTPEVESKIAELVATGDFEDANDAMLRSFESLDRERRVRHLRGLLDEAREDVAVSGSYEATPEFFREIREEVKESIAVGKYSEVDPDVWPNDAR